jgi:hypothetical protein
MYWDKPQWGEAFSQFHELGWLLAIMNKVHSLAVQQEYTAGYSKLW